MEIKKSHLPLVIISVVTKVRSSNSSYFLSHIYDVGSRGLRLNHESDWTQAGPSAMQKADYAALRKILSRKLLPLSINCVHSQCDSLPVETVNKFFLAPTKFL